MLPAFRVLAIWLAVRGLSPVSAHAAPALRPVPTLEVALARRATGDLRGALAAAEAAAAANPADGAAWTLAGDYRYALGDRTGALEAYAVARASGHGGARVAALIAALTARPATPLAARGTAMADPVNDGEADYVAALTAFNAGTIGPATERVAVLLAARPRHWEGWTLLGRCREARGDGSGSRDAWHRSLSLNPDQPGVVGWLGPVAATPGEASTPGGEGAGGSGAPAAIGLQTATPASGRPAASPVLPGPVRTGEQALSAPPPSLRYPTPALPPDAEWPLPESPDRDGVQGPLSSGGAARRTRGGWWIDAGVGIAGPGLRVIRDRIGEAYEHGARLVRTAGGTATVDSSLAAARANIHLAGGWPWRDGWYVTAGLEYAPGAEDWWREDNRYGGSALRHVATAKRSTRLFTALAGVRREWNAGGRWGFASHGALGGVRAWMDLREDAELWWSVAGPPMVSSASYAFHGWGMAGEAAAEVTVLLHPLLQAFFEAGWRLAWVPSLSTEVQRDVNGDGIPETRRVTDREPDGTPVRYDFSAFRAALGVRFTP